MAKSRIIATTDRRWSYIIHHCVLRGCSIVLVCVFLKKKVLNLFFIFENLKRVLNNNHTYQQTPLQVRDRVIEIDSAVFLLQFWPDIRV